MPQEVHVPVRTFDTHKLLELRENCPLNTDNYDVSS